MTGGAALAALQCAATAILLSFAASGVARLSAALFLLCAGVAALAPAGESWTLPLLVANAVAIILCALPIHLKDGVPAGLAVGWSACSGMLTGLALASTNGWSSLALLPLVLLFLPGQWLVSAGYGIVPKVISGWLVAIALLSAALPLVSTPGSVPDHMD